ncbi:MAG: VOC family protein [Cyclobacteriaceae bacterium]|nr:VOC family protein [Cyclobacteriaceae bacterium]
MQIKLTSVMVSDQNRAMKFYTDILKFKLKHNIPMGNASWLTVVSPDSDEVELLLEPMDFAPAAVFQKALFDAGIPMAVFNVSNIQEEYERMEKLGVVFKSAPKSMGPVTIAVFDDTCGNLIQLLQA